MRAFLAAAPIASLLGSLLAPADGQAQQAGAARATEVTFESGKLTLRGFIYKPDGPDPLPAVLWNRGSERRPGWLPSLGPLLMAEGYVLFIPHRRGQGRSPGDYVMDLLRQEMDQRGQEAWSRRLVSLQEKHLEDQLAALAFARSLPYVDRDRIAIAGCSFGGIQTVLGAERGHGARAIAFAAAAQTWKHLYALRVRLREAVRRAAMPIMLVQAENDYDLEPSRSLVKELDRLGKGSKLLIFPPLRRQSAGRSRILRARRAHLVHRDILVSPGLDEPMSEA